MKRHITTLSIFAMLGLPLFGLFSTVFAVQILSVSYMLAVVRACKRTRIGRQFVKRMDELCDIL